MRIHKGLIFNPVSATKMEILNPGYLVISDKGRIEGLFRKNPKRNFPGAVLTDYGKKVIVPGLIDTHVHLPQYAFAGIGNLELLPWLEKYTFPRESRFSDKKTATIAARVFFDDLAKNGTTTALVYGTIHKTATDIAFQTAYKKGIRVIMGKVMMDQQSPKSLTEKTTTSMLESEALIKKWHGKDNGRILYALTPRFAITCSSALMKGASALAKKYDTYIQTHLAENKGEIAFVSKLFPKSKSYTAIYADHGLLGKKTIMAHCIYTDKNERKLLKDSGAKIAHCACSNRFLQSGVMPFRKWSNEGLTIGLGTDVAGGYSLSILNERKKRLRPPRHITCLIPAPPKKSSHPLKRFTWPLLEEQKSLAWTRQSATSFREKKRILSYWTHCLPTLSKAKALINPLRKFSQG